MLESFKNVPTKSISLKTYYIEGVLKEPVYTVGPFTVDKKHTIFALIIGCRFFICISTW